MDLSYNAEELAFQQEVRQWMADNLPKRTADKVRHHRRLTKEDMVEWHDLLNKAGYLTGHWPKEFGGQAWNAVLRNIFDEEMSLAYGPRILPFGLNTLAPVLMAFGSPEQQQYYLPRIADGTDWWCRGYSEPGSGSDLASLKMSAVRDGDHYILNGQKTWTTLGQFADKIF